MKTPDFIKNWWIEDNHLCYSEGLNQLYNNGRGLFRVSSYNANEKYQCWQEVELQFSPEYRAAQVS